MTDHHDELRVAPDPSRAEELRQRLHARLASGYRDDDHEDREEDVTMLEPEDHPTNHDPVTSGRSPGRGLLVAAAAAVIAMVGTLLVAAGSDDDDEGLETATSTPTTAAPPAQDVMAVPGATEGFPDLEPGRYFIDPDGDDTTTLRVSFEIASEVASDIGPDERLDPPWRAWLGAAKFRREAATMMTVATITNVVTDGCPRSEHTPLDPPVGPTVDDLATALRELPPFEVTAPPSDVTLFGYRGKHLKLTVPSDLQRGPGVFGPTWARGGERVNENGFVVHDFEHYTAFQECPGGNLRSWFAPTKGDYAFGGYHWPGQTEEFWILDVERTRLVLVKHDSPGSTPHDIAERDAIFDTIRIEP